MLYLSNATLKKGEMFYPSDFVPPDVTFGQPTSRAWAQGHIWGYKVPRCDLGPTYILSLGPRSHLGVQSPQMWPWANLHLEPGPKVTSGGTKSPDVTFGQPTSRAWANGHIWGYKVPRCDLGPTYILSMDPSVSLGQSGPLVSPVLF